NPYLAMYNIGRTSTVDGGPRDWIPPDTTCGTNNPNADAMPPVYGNTVEGLVFDVSPFPEGEVLSLNWFFVDANGQQIQNPNAVGNISITLGPNPPRPPGPGNVFVQSGVVFARNENGFFDDNCGYTMPFRGRRDPGGFIGMSLNVAVAQVFPQSDP